jgi:NACalpha-BTF3-like transcription factor
MDSNIGEASNINSNSNSGLIKNIGNKLADEEDTSHNDTNKLNIELEGLGKINAQNEKPTATITIKEKDIEWLKNELDITYDEAKAILIKHHGDVKKAIQHFLNDFKFTRE